MAKIVCENVTREKYCDILPIVLIVGLMGQIYGKGRDKRRICSESLFVGPAVSKKTCDKQMAGYADRLSVHVVLTAVFFAADGM